MKKAAFLLQVIPLFETICNQSQFLTFLNLGMEYAFNKYLELLYYVIHICT